MMDVASLCRLLFWWWTQHHGRSFKIFLNLFFDRVLIEYSIVRQLKKKKKVIRTRLIIVDKVTSKGYFRSDERLLFSSCSRFLAKPFKKRDMCPGWELLSFLSLRIADKVISNCRFSSAGDGLSVASLSWRRFSVPFSSAGTLLSFRFSGISDKISSCGRLALSNLGLDHPHLDNLHAKTIHNLESCTRAPPLLAKLHENQKNQSKTIH